MSFVDYGEAEFHEKLGVIENMSCKEKTLGFYMLITIRNERRKEQT